MTRIVAGRAKGQRLDVPSRGTRPTSDRVREAMFSSIESWLVAEGLSWNGIDVVDLFAGSGALGLEAWSRGARRVTLVESAQSACRTLRTNVSRLGADTVTIAGQKAEQWLRGAHERVDICFVDPPYELDDERIRGLTALMGEVLMRAPDALVIVERDARASSPFAAGYEDIRERAYGDTRVWYGRPVAMPKES